jgi:hypothetical protein
VVCASATSACYVRFWPCLRQLVCQIRVSDNVLCHAGHAEMEKHTCRFGGVFIQMGRNGYGYE